MKYFRPVPSSTMESKPGVLKKSRKRLKLSLRKLHELSGVHYTFLHEMESKKVRVSTKLAQSIEKVLRKGGDVTMAVHKDGVSSHNKKSTKKRSKKKSKKKKKEKKK